MSRSRLGEPFAKLAELTAAQSRAAALQEAIEASAAEERAQAEARTEGHTDESDEPEERSEYLEELDRIGAEFAQWRHKRKMGRLANAVAALRDKRKAEADTQTRPQAKDIVHTERHDHAERNEHSGVQADVGDLGDEPCAVCGMDRPYHETECPEHLRERAPAAGLGEDELGEVLASDSDLPGCDLDGRFWWDSDYSDHDPGTSRPGTSRPGDELCAVCGMDRADHEAGCPERLRRYGRDGRGGIAIS